MQSSLAGARRLIVLIHTDHPNDAETAKQKRIAFESYGYEMLELSIGDPAAGQKLAGLLQQRGAEIFCFVSDNFTASKIRDQNNRLLHAATGIPLVFYLHDHPAHFLEEFTPDVAGSIAFVPGADLCEFIASYVRADVECVANASFFPPPIVKGRPDFEDFLSRKNEILAPMNLSLWGMTVDQLWARVKALPPPRAAYAARMVEAALTDYSRPLHAIAQGIPSQMTPEQERAFVGDQFLALNVVKLWRRNRMVRSLMDLPILVSSDYVPADLELKYPRKFTLLTMEQTSPLYARYRFIANAFPPLVDVLHERVIGAVCANAVLVTDRNLRIERFFRDGSEVIYYDYDGETTAQRLAQYIEDPRAAFELTMRNYEVREKGEFTSLASFGHLIDAVRRRWEAGSAA